jgi:hypothetical protein
MAKASRELLHGRARTDERDQLLVERVERLMTIPVLRTVRSGEEFGRHHQAYTYIQAAQQASAVRAGRGGQDGTPTESGTGFAL